MRPRSPIASWDLPSEETLRLQHQNDEHREEQNDIGELGKLDLAEIIEEPDDEAAEQRAEETAAAAQNDDDESERQHVRVEAGICREDRPAHDTREPREPRTQAEDKREEPRHADAGHARH